MPWRSWWLPHLTSRKTQTLQVLKKDILRSTTSRASSLSWHGSFHRGILGKKMLSRKAGPGLLAVIFWYHLNIARAYLTDEGLEDFLEGYAKQFMKENDQIVLIGSKASPLCEKIFQRYVEFWRQEEMETSCDFKNKSWVSFRKKIKALKGLVYREKTRGYHQMLSMAEGSFVIHTWVYYSDEAGPKLWILAFVVVRRSL